MYLSAIYSLYLTVKENTKGLVSLCTYQLSIVGI